MKQNKMKILTALMGITDLICLGIILFTFGFVWWSIILCFMMIPKAIMSFF